MLTTTGKQRVRIGGISITMSRFPTPEELDAALAALSVFETKGKGETVRTRDAELRGSEAVVSLFDALAESVEGLRQHDGADVGSMPDWRAKVPADIKVQAILSLNRWDASAKWVEVYADGREIGTAIANADGEEVAISAFLRDPTQAEKVEYDMARRKVSLGPKRQGFRGWYAAAVKLFDACVVRTSGYDGPVPAEHKYQIVSAYFKAVEEMLLD